MEQQNKLSIDIFTRPAMAAAAKDIIKVEAQKAYNDTFIEHTKEYDRNSFAFKIERELITMGVYANEAEALDGEFQYDREAGVLNILDPEDSDNILKVITIKEFPVLDAILIDWVRTVDELKVERDFRQAEYKDMHTEAWGKIYTDLVAMGVYSSVEEAKANNFTLKHGRYLQYYKEKPKMLNMAEMMREIFG